MKAASTSSSSVAWEGKLKSRSGDRYYTTYRSRDMNSCCEECKDLGEKLEEDLSLDWNSLYSYSKKCKIKDETNLQKLGDVAHHWKDMKDLIENEMGWNTNKDIDIVGGLTVTESVYNGFEVDFDDGDKDDIGMFSVTIWYDSEHDSSLSLSKPNIVELSFRIKSTGEKLEDWKRNTIMKTHAFWEDCANLLHSWIDFSSQTTKTAWVYEYDSEWCSTEKSTSLDDNL